MSMCVRMCDLYVCMLAVCICVFFHSNSYFG